VLERRFLNPDGLSGQRTQYPTRTASLGRLAAHVNAPTLRSLALPRQVEPTLAPLGAHSSKGTRQERSCTVPHSQTRKLPLGPLPTSKRITTSIRTMRNETAADQAETRNIGPLALHGLFPEYQEQ